MKNIINFKENTLGQTAMHYAISEKWPFRVKDQLLKWGANVAIKNNKGKMAITDLPARLLEEYLDSEQCLKSNAQSPDKIHDKDFKIETFIDFIIQPTDQAEPQAQTEGLWRMSQSREHRHLLTHPIVCLFLWLKWKKLGWVFSINMWFCLLYMIFFTAYILLSVLNTCDGCGFYQNTVIIK